MLVLEHRAGCVLRGQTLIRGSHVLPITAHRGRDRSLVVQQERRRCARSDSWSGIDREDIGAQSEAELEPRARLPGTVHIPAGYLACALYIRYCLVVRG